MGIGRLFGMDASYTRETRRYFCFLLISCAVLLGVRGWLFGGGVWLLAAVGSISGLLVERLTARFRGKACRGGAVVWGMSVALLVSPAMPWWMVALAVAVSALFAQEALGGVETSLFHPVLIAKAFLLISYPSFNGKDILTTPEMQEALGERGLAVSLCALGAMLILSAVLRPGTVWVYLCIAAGAVLALYGVVNPGRLAEIAGVKDCVLNGEADLRYLFLNDRWLVTALLFSVSPACLPARLPGRLACGFLIGFLSLILRGFGRYPEAMMFAILICNSVSPLFDMIWKRDGEADASVEEGR